MMDFIIGIRVGSHIRKYGISEIVIEMQFMASNTSKNKFLRSTNVSGMK